jgi:hypothetical protein
MKFNTMTDDGDGRSVGERVLDDFLINLGSRDKILTNVSQAGEMIGYRSCKKPAKNCGIRDICWTLLGYPMPVLIDKSSVEKLILSLSAVVTRSKLRDYRNCLRGGEKYWEAIRH